MTFRAFQIAREFQDRHGYPELTSAIKARILGLNAAHVYGLDAAETKRRVRSDDLSRARTAWREAAHPSFETYGPRTRRELFEMLRLERA